MFYLTTVNMSRRCRSVFCVSFALLIGLSGTVLAVAAPDATTKPVHKKISYRYHLHLLNASREVTISPQGEVEVVTRHGNQEPEKRSSKLTEKQMQALQDSFSKWDDTLKEEYHGVPDGGEYTIKFGAKTVTFGGGADIPEWLAAAQKRIEAMAFPPAQDSA